MEVVEAKYPWYCRRKMGVMRVELQISKEMAIWDDSFKYTGEAGFEIGWLNNIFENVGVGKPNRTFKEGFHMEPHLGFHFKLEHLYCFYSF